MNERDAEVIGVYVGHCLVKCANIILSSRLIGPKKRATSDDKAKKWFSLAVDEIEPAAKQLAQWRADLRRPLYIEILLQIPSASVKESDQGDSRESDEKDAPDEVLLERWVLSHDRQMNVQQSGSGSMHQSRVRVKRMDKHAMYKKMVILTRSLYSYLRMLPAYRLYRAAQTAGSTSFNLAYVLSDSPVSHSPSLDASIQFNHFDFSPLDTPSGSLKIGVDYRPSSTIRVLEETTQAQILPRIISDYINSPRQLRHLSTSMQRPPVASSPVVSAGGSQSGSSTASTRPPILHRHSWSSKDMHNVLPPQSPYGTSPSQAAPSPRPSTMNGQRHVSWSGRTLKDRTISAPSCLPVPQQQSGSMARSNSIGELGNSASVKHWVGNGEGGEQKSDANMAGTVSQRRRESADSELKESVSDNQARKGSSPVSIPGRGNQRVRSVQDIALMNASGGPENPSHPASPLEVAIAASAPNPSSTSWPQKTNIPPPNTVKSTIHTVDHTQGVSESGSSMSSVFPMSCSPQLPFAFTPTGVSVLDEPGGFGASASNASPPISGRDISALAIIRRPSWSSRSFDMQNPKFSDPMDACWLSPVNPPTANQSPAPSPNPSPCQTSDPKMSTTSVNLGGMGSAFAESGCQSDFPSFFLDSSESDLLPFALDGEMGSSAGGGGQEGTSVTATASSSQSDAAVVNFLRLMQDAPPLTSPVTSSFVSAERMKERLEEYKVKIEGFNLDTPPHKSK